MSTTDPTQTRPRVREYSPSDGAYYIEEPAGEGWVLFSGTMLAMLASLNFIYGLAAVSSSTFFVGDAKYVLSDLNTWGWVLLVISLVQIVTAFGVWARWKGVRWVGVTIAAVNAIVQLLVMPSYPLWSLCLFALDILVIYGLVAHGARRSA
jgi:hypothetical protein